MKIKSFEDLEIRQKAVQIAVDILAVSDAGKIKNDWSLKDQIRRYAFSISSNIAEGFEYNNNKDFIRFLRFVKGSAGELRSQLYVLKQAGMIDELFYDQKRIELTGLSRQIKAFAEYLRNFEQEKKNQ